MRRVGYAKLGRVQAYDPATWGPLGADNEPPMLLGRLARRNPEVQFVLLGRNDGVAPGQVGLPPNVVNPYASPDVRDAVKAATKQMKTSDAPFTGGLQDYIDAMRVIFSPWTADLDGLVLWLGQTDQAQTPIPAVRSDKPYQTLEMYRLHVSYYVDLINSWRGSDPLSREPVWLCSDVWNRMKARDLAWPQRHPVLCQYDWSHNVKHYRFGDTRAPSELGFAEVARVSKTAGCWESTVSYGYSGLELGCSVPSNLPYSDNWDGRDRFGVLVNASRAKSGRDQVVRDWIKPMNPDWIRGSWDKSAAELGRQEKLGVSIEPVPWRGIGEVMPSARSTLAVPIRLDGQSWATPKAWEMFALGVVCFFHPKYDDQGHILPTLEQCKDLSPDNELRVLAQWLRVRTPDELRERIDRMNVDRDGWLGTVQRQRLLYEVASGEQRCVKMIEDRLGIDNSLRAVA